MSNNSTFSKIALELGKVFEPLIEDFSSFEGFSLLLENLGWNFSALSDTPTVIENLTQNATEVKNIIEDISEGAEIEIQDLETLVDKFFILIEAIKDLENGVGLPSDLINQNFHLIFPRQLIDYYLVNYLLYYHPFFGHLLGVLGIIRREYIPEISPFRPAYFSNEIAYSDITKIFNDPFITFKNGHGWDSFEFETKNLFFHLDNLFASLGVETFIDYKDKEVSERINIDQVQISPNNTRILNIPIYTYYSTNYSTLVGIGISKLLGDGIKKPGLTIFPFFSGNISQEISISEKIKLLFLSNLNIQEGLAINIRPNENLNFILGINNDPNNAVDSSGSLSFEVITEGGPNDKIVLFSTQDGTSFDINQISLKAEFISDKGNELLFGLSIKEAKLSIKPGEDGFLSKILSEGGLSADFDFILKYSTLYGISFDGGFGLEIILPITKKIGPLSLKSFSLKSKPNGEVIPFQLATSLGLQLGPFNILVDNIGMKADMSFPPDLDGNLGVLDFDIAFKPPNGLGLSFEAKAVSGGGYLYFDHDKHEYAGVAALSIKEKIALKAIGLLTTRLPDGSKGFSLLLIVTAEFPGIQLGFGFILTGIGGILGTHRTMKLDALRSGLKTGTNDRLLFPSNPVENATQIISDLKSIFPVEEGRFVFGFAAKIVWGAPPLLTIKLGLIIELFNPIRIAILGVLKAALPEENNPLLLIQVNFLGTIEFEKGLIAFDATLFDSKLLSIKLFGDMALRIGWKEPKQMVLTLGGFHPKFQAPAGLGHVQRLTLNFLGGDNPRLTLTTYFALTSNSVQFGARADIYIKVTKKLTAEGYFGFDVLFQFNPFYMSLQAYAYLGLKWKGKDKMSISLDLSLEGPTPWNAKGEAKVKILGIKFKVKASKTWGDRKDTSLPAVKVSLKLIEALGVPNNWIGVLPSGRQLVTLRKMDSLVGIVHPVGALQVSQKVLPLGITIQKFGTQDVSDGGVFSIDSIEVGSQTLTDAQAVKEDFVPANFRALSENQKLSKPSFEKYQGGVQVSANEFLEISYFVKRAINYEYSIAGQEVAPGDPLLTRAEDQLVLEAMASGTMADRSPLSYTAQKKSSIAPETITILEEKYGVVNRTDLKLYTTSSLKDSYEEAVDHYSAIVRDNPSLKRAVLIVPEFEIEP